MYRDPHSSTLHQISGNISRFPVLPVLSFEFKLFATFIALNNIWHDLLFYNKNLDFFYINNYLDFSGLSLRKTAAIMSRLNLYVGVDTGPTHLMSSFDVPSVSLYHGKFPSRLYAPLNHPFFVSIDHPLGKFCSELSSMSDITVQQVFRSLKPFLLN